MSELVPKQRGIQFGPIPDRASAAPNAFNLILGVIWPGAVIVIELATRLCAGVFFDPMPTIWHVLAVALVPASNLLLWLRLRQPVGASEDAQTSDCWLVLVNGAAIAIAGSYTLIFLPLLLLAISVMPPLAFPIGVGFVLLPMAPVAGFVAAIQLASRLHARVSYVRLGRLYGGGIVAGLAFLLALEVPAAATRLGLQWASSSAPPERERGLTLLRAIGDHHLLLRLCYDPDERPGGLLSALVMVGGNSLRAPDRQLIVRSLAGVREAYFRVTGKPFNAEPLPFKAGLLGDVARDFKFGIHYGGTEVGGRIKGLDIVSSHMDVSITANDAVAYLEWIFEIRNTSMINREAEARLQIALPPGGVVSRATMWINGDEREGAYGGRADARASYQPVAVQQQRHPLLVTTRGADRVLAQAFPVAPNGGTIKFKIGITAPLELLDRGNARLTLPAIFDRNFSFPDDVGHSIWIESRQPLAATVQGIAATRVDGGPFRMTGTLSDGDLARTRPTISVKRDPDTGPVASRLGDGEVVVQEVATSVLPQRGALMLVVDGSARMRHAASSLAAAIRSLPREARVGLIVATEPVQRMALAPASDEHKERLARLVRQAAYVGGQDNGPALVGALLELESEPNARLLWIHGPQPVAFRRSAADLEQATVRPSQLAEVILYAVEPGPNELLPDQPWGWSGRTLPRTASPEVDLAGFFEREFSDAPTPALRRAAAQSGVGMPMGSDHIARLWAKDRIGALMRVSSGGNRGDAVALAVQYRLVTPVSGAVVLETKQQYDESRLTPVSQSTLPPTIREPREWPLMLVACMVLSWLAWPYRRRPAGSGHDRGQ